ncbi:hypothetical protein [Metaclostridioides mangenotii]|uniref:hypothetical protein n=1 Tax=Metaclostridioides mangenotii TaxID=1540 RepID=UPI0004803DA1|nr:hypothetical protein [Clostridioides mangenotii]
METESKYETLLKKVLGIVELNPEPLKENTELFNLAINSLKEFSNNFLLCLQKSIKKIVV